MEAVFTLLSAYLCFQIGEVVGLSGIIVCLFGGLIMGIYLTPNLKTPEITDAFLDNAARLADLVIFVICGFGVFRMGDFYPVSDGLKLGLLTCVFCFLSRALACAL